MRREIQTLTGTTAITRRLFSVGIFVASLALATLAIPQSLPLLQISSPSNGTVVNSGQTLSVTVTSPAGLTFQTVSIIGPHPIGFSGAATSAPAQFSIAIPLDSDAGPCTFTSLGLTQSGQGVYSAPVQIDIERSDLPASLSTRDSSDVEFESLGAQVHSTILANFADGTTVDVTNSTLVSYTSSNTAVATVDASGTITAQSSGSAIVTVTYTLGSASLPLPIPVTVKAPKLAVSPASLDFPSQATGTSSSSQQLTITNGALTPTTVLSVDATGDFSETDDCVASSPLAPGATCTITVTFSPAAVGTRPGTISIANTATTVSVRVSLTGIGTVPTTLNITSLSPASGAIGTPVTVTGSGFGDAQGASTVTFSGVSATPSSWTATSLLVPVPAGATTGNVIVTVGGIASNAVNFTVQGTTNGISLVQHASIDVASSSSSSLAFPSNNSAGNWIGVCVRAGRSGETFTVADTLGNTYIQASQLNITVDTPNGDTLAIFYAENISAGANSVTVSDSTAATLRFAVFEYTGVATLGSLNVTAQAQGTSTAPSSGNATTSANGDLLLGAIATADALAFTEGTGFEMSEFVPAEPNTKLGVEYQIQTLAGASSATVSLYAADPWGTILASFKRAGP